MTGLDPEVPAVLRGLRDNLFRIVALDRTEPTVLWSLDANDNPDKLWNDDWDGAALVIGDYLLEGGSVLRGPAEPPLRRRVLCRWTKIVMQVPGYDDQLLSDLGDENVSIELGGLPGRWCTSPTPAGWSRMDISDILNGGTKYERVFGSGTGTRPTPRS